MVIKIKVDVKDRTGQVKNAMYDVKYDFLGEYGYKIAREARKVLGKQPKNYKRKPRTPPKAPLNRRNILNQIRWHRSKSAKDTEGLIAGPLRFTKTPQRGQMAPPGLHEHGKKAWVWKYPSKKVTKQKSRTLRRKYHNMTHAQREVVREKGKAGAAARWQQRKKDRVKSKKFRMPQRIFMGTAAKRINKRIPTLLKKSVRKYAKAPAPLPLRP